MRTRLLLLLCLMIPARMIFAQAPATIEKVEVTGISDQTLSKDLRDSIQKLNGQRYDAQAAEQLAGRIEAEIKDTVAAPKTLPGTQASRVRLVFVVAHLAPEAEVADTNVNSQYIVESVEVKGLMRSQYSDALYDDMQKMIGQMLDNAKVEELRKRLVEEPLLKNKPFVTQKIERGSQPEHIKVVFQVTQVPWVVRKIFGDHINVHLGVNIGTPDPTDKDTVESVGVKGVRGTLISTTLRADLQKMVGKRYDKLEADHLHEKLEAELKDRFSVKLNVEKGSKDGLAKITYQATEIPWLPSRGRPEIGAYHQKQGVSVFCCEDNLFKNLFVNVGTNGDTLIERYKGFGVGLDSTSLGTRHLGARLDLSTFGIEWKSQTLLALAANPSIPGAYRTRQAIEPSVAFAFNRNFYISSGLNFTELRMISPALHWQSTHEATASFHYDSKDIKRGKTTIKVTSGYDVRTATRNLSSDFVYTRHLWDASYTVKSGKNTGKVSLTAGKITGNAPLFERFSLGNTTTLRGWNKYDLDPVGGTRMVSLTSDYTWNGLGFFVNSGAVWSAGQSVKNRHSIGVEAGPFSLAIPLKCSGDCGPTFMVHF